MWYFVGILRWLHRRRQASEKKQLETLQKSQKETLEELKKRTKFDKTKSLIEKYEGTPRRSGSGTGLADLGSGTPATQSGLRRPPPFVTPSKMAPGSAPSTPATPANLPGSLMSPPAPVPRPALIVGIDSSLRAAVPPGPPSAGTTYDTPRAWYDKLFDALIGPPEGPNSKYALICSKCFAHNGLALAEEFDDIRGSLEYESQRGGSYPAFFLHQNSTASVANILTLVARGSTTPAKTRSTADVPEARVQSIMSPQARRSRVCHQDHSRLVRRAAKKRMIPPRV